MTAQPEMSRAERRRQETRQEIIDAAFACFAERGYHHTGIADIAARLGMGHGTFYRHFENKRDIVDHVITDLIGKVLAALQADNAPEAVDTLEDYRAQSGRIGEALTTILADDPRIPRMLVLEAPGIDAAMAERVLGFHDLAAELTGGYLEHGVRLGYLRTGLDIEGTARAINGMILAQLLVGISDTDPDLHRRLREATLSLMYDGIAADRPAGE